MAIYFRLKLPTVVVNLAFKMRKHLSKDTCSLGNYDSNFTSHVNAENICSKDI